MQVPQRLEDVCGYVVDMSMWCPWGLEDVSVGMWWAWACRCPWGWKKASNPLGLEL